MSWRKWFKKSDRTIYECPLCEGKERKDDEEPCPKCLGTGTLDWIENIVGKRNLMFRINPYESLVIPMIKLFYSKEGFKR